MAPLGESTQPGEELAHDAAESAPHDQRVEHGGGRVRRCVERFDPHHGPPACRRVKWAVKPWPVNILMNPKESSKARNEAREGVAWAVVTAT
jgi:hypothetical protein